MFFVEYDELKNSINNLYIRTVEAAIVGAGVDLGVHVEQLQLWQIDPIGAT